MHFSIVEASNMKPPTFIAAWMMMYYKHYALGQIIHYLLVWMLLPRSLISVASPVWKAARVAEMPGMEENLLRQQ